MSVPSDLLEVARRHAEQLMTSTCTIREPSTGQPTTDPDTGQVAFPPGEVVYAGPCRVRPATGPGGDSATRDAGAVQVLAFDYLVSVPFAVTGVRERHRVTIDASPDPSLVGVEVEVQHIDRGDHLSARRLQCREVA